jgi:hypothetical protein
MQATDFNGVVFDDETGVCLARVGDFAGNVLTQADCSSITYTITDLNSGAVLAGHSNVSLTVADVIFDTLQEWDIDETGYNFRYEIPRNVSEAFPDRDHVYEIRFRITPTEGQRIAVRFRVNAI